MLKTKLVKIRRWDWINQKFIEPHQAFVSPNSQGIQGNDSRFVNLEFTGRLDAHKKEIYMGHIVKWKNGIIQKVEWDDAECRVLGLPNFQNPEVHPCEIIGDVFHNPDLLST